MTRRRSLKKDVNDFKQFRYGRDRHLGVSVSSEFYQPVPFFFTREGANLPLIGNYRGGSIFIVCNGPSLASGNYDLSLLKRPGVMTYGMNNGARTIRPNFWTCVDDPRRFLKSIWLDPRITKFVPHAHAEKTIFDNEKWEEMKFLVGQCPNVVYYHRNEKFMADRFLFEDTINWGNSGDNGGGRSVLLPVLRICFLLGFRNIYLLGADFKMSSTYTYHFDEQRAKGAVNCNMNTYDRLKNDYLPALKPYLDAEGVNVFNCNPESELKVFDYMPYEEAIKNATLELGDVQNERTWGMYSKPEERKKWMDEPDESKKAHLETIKNKPSSPVWSDNVSMQENKKEDIVSKIEQQIARHKPIIEQPQQPQQPQQQVVPQVAPEVVPVEKPIVEAPVTRTMKDVQVQVENELNSRKIIRGLPCGAIMSGSSNNPSNNITIPDDGN